MRVPDLSSLTLTPLDVAGVGVEGPQCDPRARTRGLCVIARPTRETLNQVKDLVPRNINYRSTGLAFRIDPSSPQWVNQTPYETMYESHQFSAFTRMLDGRVPELTLMYSDATSGEWVEMERLTWEQLAERNILPQTPKKNEFWLKLRYLIPPIANTQNTVRVLTAMHKYNLQHSPMWLLQKRKDAEKAAAASSRPAAPPPPPQPPPTLPPLEELIAELRADAWFKKHFFTSMQDVPAFAV